MLLVQGPDSETHCGIFSRPDVREALQHCGRHFKTVKQSQETVFTRSLTM